MKSTTRKAAPWLFAAAASLVSAGLWAQQQNLGYSDTPFLPGNKWHVHDGMRPQPKAIDPGTASTQDTPGRPPSDATVLFDGKDASKFRSDKGGDAEWKVENGALIATAGKGAIYSKEEFGDCQLHVEWSAPAPPKGTGQGRGNSGVFLMGRYEIQVLDSYNAPTYPDGQASAIYAQYPPLVNASRKPGEWQTYDIVWTGPRFDADGRVTRPAFATVLHNGVVVHNHTELLGPMAHRTLTKYSPHGPKGPVGFQDHGDPVRFRNVWIRELRDYDQP